MILGFGLAFELPLAWSSSTWRVLTHERFAKWRRMMIFGAFLFAGIANPSPDPLHMLMLAVPCVVLVEVAEVIIWFNDRRRARLPDPYADLADNRSPRCSPAAEERTEQCSTSPSPSCWFSR